MSFAAVTAPALLALQQTGTFNKQLQQLGKATIAFFSIPVQAGWCQAAFCVFLLFILKWSGLVVWSLQLIDLVCDSVTPCHGVISSPFFLMLNIICNHFVICIIFTINSVPVYHLHEISISSENSNLPLWHFGLYNALWWTLDFVRLVMQAKVLSLSPQSACRGACPWSTCSEWSPCWRADSHIVGLHNGTLGNSNPHVLTMSFLHVYRRFVWCLRPRYMGMEPSLLFSQLLSSLLYIVLMQLGMQLNCEHHLPLQLNKK